MFILYIFDIIFNPISNYFQLELPYWLRWIGGGIFASADLFFIWIHYHLGLNFFSTLKIRTNHKLIITGPYKRTRHPMYTAFFMMHIGVFLITANWLLGVISISGLIVLFVFRIKKEENMMIENFGSEYENYMKRTYRFFPKFSGF
jgi:protein-S-isoprenylcysteine O-methyltransferase Ste14